MANPLPGIAVDVGGEKENAAAGNHAEVEDEGDEYVLLDLEEVFHGAALPPNCTYTISGLDTMNPILTLGDNMKLIGEYEETVGTVFIFTERDEEVPEEERIRGSKEKGTKKRVSNFCEMKRKLKFRMMDDKENKETRGQEIRSQVL